MTTFSNSHIEPEKNRDPAEAGRDPQQLTAEGKPGAAYDLYSDTEATQTAGSRNDRVTEFQVNDHNTEPFNAPAPNEYESGTAKGGQGISSHSLTAELKEQDKLADEPDKKPSIGSTKRSLMIAISFLLLATAASAQSPVSCSTHGQSRQFCRAETQNGVLLLHDHSHGSCQYGSTWGFNPHGIYVSGGCNADFLVNGPSSQNGHGQDDHPGGNGSGQNGFESGNSDQHEHHLTLPAGTPIQVRLDQEVRAQNVQQGDAIPATLAHDLTIDGRTLAPAGTRVRLKVVEKNPNRPESLSIQLDSLRTDRERYRLATNTIHGQRESDGPHSGDNGGGGLGGLLNQLENGNRRGDLAAGSLFTFRLLSPSQPERLNPNEQH